MESKTTPQPEPARLGGPCRTLRRARGLTLDALAERVGVSKGHLSRFERGDKMLSVAALLRLAEALGCSVSELLGETVGPQSVSLLRRGDVERRTVRDGSGYAYEVAALTRLQPDVQVFELHLSPQSAHAESARHTGIEAIYVLAGVVAVELADKRHRLAAGDFIEFPAQLPHALRPEGGAARCLIIAART